MSNAHTKRNHRARKIAQAALGLFARKGYIAGSVEEISAEADIGKSTVYEYYRNKEELFIAAVQEGAEQWFKELKAIGQKTENTVERLRRIADLYIEDYGTESKEKSRLFLEVVSQTHLQGGIFYKQRHLVINLYQRYIRAVVDYLLEGISGGQLRPEIAFQAEKIAINFLAYLDGMALHRLVVGDHVDPREQIDLFLKHLEPLLIIESNEAA
jgi:AcrR family transcriptional regulator